MEMKDEAEDGFQSELSSKNLKAWQTAPLHCVHCIRFIAQNLYSKEIFPIIFHNTLSSMHEWMEGGAHSDHEK